MEAALPLDFDPDLPTHADWYDELAAELPLDPYASRDPAEFFAVASEAFFVAPQLLADGYPQIYRKLAAYYRQNPLEGGRSGR
jgi:Mlc titration factor MtfA (ptsG expression regulator)